ncbi:MAG: PorT family protein [Prevotella sp.]|nr:PorT family protein [Prevotella sp.]
MKKMFFIAVMTIVAMSASAQREVGSLTLQPKVGLNGPIMFMNDDNLDYENFGRFVGGAEVEYQIKKWLSVSAGVLYSQEGGKTKIKDINVVEKAKLDYINIPVMANFYVWKGLALKIGVQPSFKVNEKIEHGMSPAPVPNKYAFEDKAEGFDLKLPIGISYDFGGIVLELRSAPGMVHPFKNKNYISATGQLTIGYKFALK